jgi:cell division protein YceG involved in septum cleavage
MRRVYNDKISARANNSLERRAAVVRSQKRMIALIVIAIIFFGILLGTGISALASNDKATGQYKYYKSICIEEGDTLWDIAGKYVEGTDMDRYDYIQEICDLNGIHAEEIHAGDYIIVSYYSDELK